MILVGMWADVDAEAYWKASATVAIFAVATVHVCLLGFARLAGRFRWGYFITCQIVYGLASLLAIMIIGEIDDDGAFRLLATVSIVDAALTLVIPLQHRISKTDTHRTSVLTALDDRNVAGIDGEIARLKRRISELGNSAPKSPAAQMINLNER